MPKDKDWFAEYAWIQLPHNDVPKEPTRELNNDIKGMIHLEPIPEEKSRGAQTQANFAKKEDMAKVDMDLAARTTKKSNLKTKPQRAPSADSDRHVTFPTLSMT